MLAALLMGPLVHWVDDLTQWRLLGFGVEGARAVVGALSASLLSFIVFIFSMLLLVVQLAGAQLSPRIIMRPFERGVTKATLGVFVFAYAYSLTALGRIEGEVPQLSVFVAVFASLLSIALFLYLIQSIGRRCRPTVVLSAVADDVAAVVTRLYPVPFDPLRGDASVLQSSAAGRALQHGGRSGIVVAVDLPRLVTLAEGADCRIELLPRVGEFIATGQMLYNLHGPAVVDVDLAQLERCVKIAAEQTIEEDPLFGIRIIVDIASKAVSPGISDAGTGIAAIDQLHHLLNLVGHRQFDAGIIRDAGGEIRVLYRAAAWDDFVALAVTEVHSFVGKSQQVHRRFSVMVAQLSCTLPEARARVLGEALRRAVP